jgi:3-isopropylmalate dehydrogenase
VGSSKAHRIAVIGGDGIGPEVTDEGLKVLRAAGLELETTTFDLGADRYLRDGEVLSDETMAKLGGYEAILLGAVGPAIGDDRIPNGTLERGLLLKMRFGFDQYINLRPFYGVPGSIADGADFVVIRENTEGTYAGEGGLLRPNTPHEIATQGSVNTRFGVERCVRFAFDLAASRPAKHLTLVHKTNVLTFSGTLWQRVFNEVATEFPEVAVDYNHIDAACIYMVERAARYDVIVTDNLFGDILTDLAGAVTGGIGFAASGNLNPDHTGPSMFEPVHGAAHDIAGQHKANPLAAIASAALMATDLGEPEIGGRIAAAVRAYADENPTTTASTAEIGDAIARKV